MVDKNKKLQKKLEDILPDSVKDREGKAVEHISKHLNRRIVA